MITKTTNFIHSLTKRSILLQSFVSTLQGHSSLYLADLNFTSNKTSLVLFKMFLLYSLTNSSNLVTHINPILIDNQQPYATSILLQTFKVI